jgi:tetratricopeptide (TPR) repeat protein
VTELRDALTGDPTVQWLEGRCVSYGQALPYWPFRDLLRRWLHASVNDPEERLRTALRSRIGSLFERGAPEVAPFLAAILGLQLEPDAATALNALSPEALQFRTNEAMCSLVERVASTGPVVVAIDDLHWADSTSVQLLERLLALADSTPTLFVIAHRPERDHPSWRLHRTAGRARVLELDALHEGADRQLLEGLVGSGTLPADLERRILVTAEGNPFYLEELVRSLVDAEALVSQAGRWKFDHSVDVEIPPTVEKVILARIDRLSSGARDAVQAASVLGRQFGLPLLRAVSDLDGRLSPALDELLRLDFLRREGSEPEPEYRFKHALIQEAAYQNMLKRRRRELHARAAQALKSLYEDRLEQPHGLLAHHYRGAGDLDRALRSFELAAGAARRVYAVEEALAHYSAALDIAISLASTRTGELYLQRGQVHAQAGDSSRARADLEAALAHARTSGDRRVEMHALSDIGFLLAGLASYGGALPHLGSALEVAEAAGDLAGQAGILSRLSIVYCNQLLFDRALEFAERARAVAERVGEDPVLATALDALKQVSLQIGDWETLGLIARDLGDILRRHDELWYLQFVLHESSFIGSASGEWEVSLERLQEALALNRRIGDRGNEPLHHAGLCMVNRMAGRYGPALEAGVRGCDLAAALDHAEWIGWAEATLGRLFIDLRAMDEAARHLERSAEASERAGAHTMTSRGLGHLAFVRLRQGRLDEAVPLMRRTEELLRGITTPPGWPYVFGTDVYVAVARVRLGLGEPEKAEAWVEPLRRTTERTRWVEASAFLPLVLGECMLARGDLSAAREHLEFAIEAASVGGLPAVEWEGHGVLAGVLRSDGRLEEAERHLETGLRIVQGLSATIPDTRARRRFVEGATAELRRRGGAT